MREKKSNNFYTKVTLLMLIAIVSVFCGAMLFFNSFNQNNLENKKVYAATTVTAEAELIDALNNGETNITLGTDVTVSSAISLSNVSITGSSTLTISSTGIVNVGEGTTIDISSISVSGVLNIVSGTIRNDILITDSGICNIIGGVVNGNITVNSNGQLNLAQPTAASISITGTINLDNGRYINVEYPIANSANKFKVHVNDGAADRVVVKYDKDIQDAQVVASTFKLLNNPTFILTKVLNENGNDDFYSLNLADYSAVVNYVAYNGSDSLTGAPDVVVKLNGVEVGVLSPTNTCIILDAISGTLNLTGNYISVNADFTSNPTNLSTCSSKTYTISGATNYDVYVRDIYTITMDPNGGNNTTTRYKVHGLAQNINYGAKPVKQHYEFVNWNTASDGTGTPYDNGASYTTNSDLLVYAQWTNGYSNYSVRHYVMNTSGEYPSNPTQSEQKSGIFGGTINAADLVKSSLLVSNGIEFDHAEVDGVTVAQTTILEDDSRVVNLYYNRLQHTLTLSCGLGISLVFNGGTETTGAVSYYYGQSVSIDATVESDDYVWKNWTGYQTLNSKSTTVQIPAQDIAFTANAAEEVKYDITIAVNDSTSGSVDKTTFKAKNNSIIAISNNTISIGGTTVTATANTDTAEWEYTFENWTGVPAGNRVTADLTITANFAKEKQKYTVTWRNWDNSVIDTDEVEYGKYASWGSRPVPTRPDDEQFCNYTFTGWDGLGLLLPVTQPTSLKATFTGTLRTYTVLWKNDDGTIIETDDDAAYGSTPEYDGETPTKESNAQYTYTFNTWTPEIAPVTGNAVYTATYTPSKRSYTITWLNYDGTPLCDPMVVEYGVVPEYTSATPQRTGEGKSYQFIGWLPHAPVAVTEDVTYVANFSVVVDQHVVTIDVNNTDYGSVDQVSISVDYNSQITVLDNTITIGSVTITATPADDTDQYDYEFINWTGIPEGSKVTGDVTITANFGRETKKYTVTWLNYNGTEIETDSGVPYGSLPSFNKANPTRSATEEYTYTFAGWAITADSEIGTDANQLPEVHGDITYYAAYSKTKNKYTITWLNWDGTPLKSEPVEYGLTPSYSGTPTRPAEQDNSYLFTGWDPMPVPVTGPAEYTAQYSSTVNQYIVTIEVNNSSYGSVDKLNIAVDYNTEISVSGNVLTIGATTITATETADTDEFDYLFVKWEGIPANGKVIDHITVTAIFEQTTKTYTIIWQDEDGTELERDENVAYGTTPQYNGVTPAKASTESLVYTFKGWSPATSQVTGNATYRATYNSTTRKYTITWLNWDNSPLGEPTQVDYGTMPNYPYATPTKTSDEHYEYEFDGWTPALTNVTGDTTYKAKFEDVVHQYKVTINFDKTKCISNPALTINISGESIDIVNEGSVERILDYGTNVTVVATIQGAYNMVWAEDDVNATRVNNLPLGEFVLQEDCDFTLYISQIFTVSIIYDDTIGSVDKGSSVNAICGESVSLTATPNNGYKFVYWEKHGSFVAENLSKPQATIPNISTNCEIEANFEIVVYKIKVFVDGVLTETEYTINSQEIALPTPSKDGFNFIGWTGSNGSRPEKNITIQAGSFGDKVFYANFSKPEGNDKLIIIIAAAAAIVVVGVVITIIVASKNKRGRKRKKPITIDLSRFK